MRLDPQKSGQKSGLRPGFFPDRNAQKCVGWEMLNCGFRDLTDDLGSWETTFLVRLADVPSYLVRIRISPF